MTQWQHAVCIAHPAQHDVAQHSVSNGSYAAQACTLPVALLSGLLGP